VNFGKVLVIFSNTVLFLRLDTSFEFQTGNYITCFSHICNHPHGQEMFIIPSLEFKTCMTIKSQVLFFIATSNFITLSLSLMQGRLVMKAKKAAAYSNCRIYYTWSKTYLR